MKKRIKATGHEEGCGGRLEESLPESKYSIPAYIYLGLFNKSKNNSSNNRGLVCGRSRRLLLALRFVEKLWQRRKPFGE